MKKNNIISVYLLPILIILTFVFLTVDALKSPGATGRHIFVDSRFFWALSLVLILFFVSAKSTILDFLFKLNLTLLPLLCLIYLLFAGIEVAHFPNYVLSVYNIHLQGLIFLPVFSISLFIAGKARYGLPKLRLTRLKDFVLVAIVVFITYFLVKNLSDTLEDSVDGDLYIFSHIENSYSGKMFYNWGDYYYLMSFVKNNTPENATIVIPPDMEPWTARSGDIYLDRAFLYPRDLIQYNDGKIPDAKSLKAGTYILVSWGFRDCYSTDCHGWPNQEIKAKRILYKDPDSDKVIEIRENFIYKKDDYKYVYGLIEI